MKFVLIAACTVSMAASEAAAAPAFSWFHTRPKPVILIDDTDSAVPKTTRVPYHGTAMYPGSGRIYFSDKVDHNRETATPPTRSRMTTSFTRGWADGTTTRSGVSHVGKASPTR